MRMKLTAQKNNYAANFNETNCKIIIKPYSSKTFKVRLEKCRTTASEPEYELATTLGPQMPLFNEFAEKRIFKNRISYVAELLWILYSQIKSSSAWERKRWWNGMTCKGDTIYLPDGQYTHLYFLAACNGWGLYSYILPRKTKRKSLVPSQLALIGQWGHTNHTKGYLKRRRDSLCRYNNCRLGEDQPLLEFTYMFKLVSIFSKAL